MPTKMIHHPTPNFADSLISSIGALYLTIISFVLIYSYVGVNLYQQNQTVTKLVALDKLLALHHLTAEQHLHSSVRDAKLKDLPRFFVDAQSESFDELAKEVEAEDKSIGNKKPESTPSKFTEEALPRSRVFRDVTMRMAVSGTCNVLVTNLLPGQEYQFATFLIVGGVYNVKSEDVQLVSFLRCEPGPSGEFKVLIFKLDDDQFAVAVPRSLEEEFLGVKQRGGFSNFVFHELDQTIKLLPEPLGKYVNFLEQYVFLHVKAVDYFILNYANDQLGKHFPPDRLVDAIQQVYEQKERDASYFGINAPGIFLIRIGPFIYFVLSFELWRRVRRLPSGKLLSDKYWFAFETRDMLGRVYGFLYALAPLLFGLLIYTLFAISQGLALIVFDRVVTIPGLLTFDFPMAPGRGWVTGDGLAVAIGVFLVPAHFLILMLTVRKLVGVVSANRQPK